MDYSKLSPSQWEAVLSDVAANPPVAPRKLIFVPERAPVRLTVARPDTEERERRRAMVQGMIDGGMTQTMAAKELGLSLSSVCRILSGER